MYVCAPTTNFGRICRHMLYRVAVKTLAGQWWSEVWNPSKWRSTHALHCICHFVSFICTLSHSAHFYTFWQELMKRHSWTFLDFGGGFMQALMLSRTRKCIYYAVDYSICIGQTRGLGIVLCWRFFTHLLEKCQSLVKKLLCCLCYECFYIVYSIQSYTCANFVAHTHTYTIYIYIWFWIYTYIIELSCMISCHSRTQFFEWVPTMWFLCFMLCTGLRAARRVSKTLEFGGKVPITCEIATSFQPP